MTRTRHLTRLRTDLLEQLVALLRIDPTVRAAALVGSLGVGTADDWSDIDLMILMDDNEIMRFADQPADRAWARAPLLVDSRHNAPAGATQVNADHVLAGLPFWVDFCVFPASQTAWPVGHRVIFEHQPIQASGQTFDMLTSRQPRQPPKMTTPGERRQAHLAFVPLTAKYIARGQPEHVRDMIRFIGAAPGYADLEAEGQLDMLGVITRRLSDPSSAWLSQAVMSYLDLVEGVSLLPA